MEIILRVTYIGLFAWQFIWHGWLPAPLGSENWLLATLAALPLLLPLRGVLTLQHHGLIWGGFLLVLYFLAGVMEAWSNAPQRPAALVQVMLVVAYFALLSLISRRRSPPAD